MRRSRADLAALERLEAALPGVQDGRDVDALGKAVRAGLGAWSISVGEPAERPGPLQRDIRIVIAGDPVTVRGELTQAKAAPSDTALALMTARLQARVDELEARREADAMVARQRAIAELASALVGSFEPATIEAALQSAAVGYLVDELTLTTAARADEPADDAEHAYVRRHDRWVIRGERDAPWHPAEVEALDAMVDMALRALDAHERFAAERHTRTVIERSLVPEAFVPMEGVAIASRYRPAGGGREAGGDFYDIVRNEPGVTILIGDVQGKGVEATTVTSLARHTLRNGALRGIAPSALLSELNTALLYGQREQELVPGPRGLAPVRFVTAAVAALSRTAQGMRVVVARGGHPPPIVIRWQGDIEVLQPTGILLGVKPNPKFEETTTELVHGDTLVLYTDGITEHRDLGQAFDERMLGMLVRSSAQVVGVEPRADLVLETTLLRVPPDARDDIAIVLATVTGRTD